MSKYFEQGNQGDVMFVRVQAIPAGYNEVKRTKGQPVVCAHSETGHDHVINDDGAVVYEGPDPLRAYLRLADDVEVVHKRSYDTHAPVTLRGDSIWEVRRQREYDPAGERRAAD